MTEIQELKNEIERLKTLIAGLARMISELAQMDAGIRLIMNLEKRVENLETQMKLSQISSSPEP